MLRVRMRKLHPNACPNACPNFLWEALLAFRVSHSRDNPVNFLMLLGRMRNAAVGASFL